MSDSPTKDRAVRSMIVICALLFLALVTTARTGTQHGPVKVASQPSVMLKAASQPLVVTMARPLTMER